jgi:hypothetical protein
MTSYGCCLQTTLMPIPVRTALCGGCRGPKMTVQTPNAINAFPLQGSTIVQRQARRSCSVSQAAHKQRLQNTLVCTPLYAGPHTPPSHQGCCQGSDAVLLIQCLVTRNHCLCCRNLTSGSCSPRNVHSKQIDHHCRSLPRRSLCLWMCLWLFSITHRWPFSFPSRETRCW